MQVLGTGRASAARMQFVRWLAISFVPAIIGSPFPAPEYYRRLDRPSWGPPPWLFAPVWTFLYASMGVAAWLVARRSGFRSRGPLLLFGSQLVLNATWTPIFFGLRSPGLALVNIVLLWVAIAATFVAFLGRRTAAGVLLIPYLAWVTFASALNYAIWRRN